MVTIMVYVALAILGAATVVFGLRTLRSAWRRKMSSMFADLGVTFLFVFASLVLASVGTTVGPVLAGSPVIMVIIWVIASVGGVGLILATVAEPLLRSIEEWKFRRNQRRAKRLDKRNAKTAKSQKNQSDSRELFDQLAGSSHT